jgi:hypothetical protein
VSVRPEDLRRYRRGHHAAAVRLRAETLRALADLTVEQAREEYDRLCAVWREPESPEERRALDRLAIRDRVALRRKLLGAR